jgi:XRE family aerobic/anaerobic benzoate catabolism transcriptional regulator
MSSVDYGKSGLLESIGAKVRALRVESHLTIKDLAQQSGLSVRFISQLEAGQGNISIVRLAGLASALGRSLQELIPSGKKSTPEFIALVGLRGAGKSTVGAQLARKLRTEFIEIDSLVERTAGISLGEIFAIHGEDYYRRLEREVLARLFAESKGCVLATGGSIVTDAESWDLVRRRCFTVWLRATSQEHMNRVLRQGDTRPMKDNPSAMAELKSLLARREPLYAQSDLALKTSGETPTDIVSKIGKSISSYAS